MVQYNSYITPTLWLLHQTACQSVMSKSQRHMLLFHSMSPTYLYWNLLAFGVVSFFWMEGNRPNAMGDRTTSSAKKKISPGCGWTDVWTSDTAPLNTILRVLLHTWCVHLWFYSLFSPFTVYVSREGLTALRSNARRWTAVRAPWSTLHAPAFSLVPAWIFQASSRVLMWPSQGARSLCLDVCVLREPYY